MTNAVKWLNASLSVAPLPHVQCYTIITTGQWLLFINIMLKFVYYYFSCNTISSPPEKPSSLLWKSDICSFVSLCTHILESWSGSSAKDPIFADLIQSPFMMFTVMILCRVRSAHNQLFSKPLNHSWGKRELNQSTKQTSIKHTLQNTRTQNLTYTDRLLEEKLVEWVFPTKLPEVCHCLDLRHMLTWLFHFLFILPLFSKQNLDLDGTR